MSIPRDYLERVYAGFIGKAVGVRLGAPVEPAIWTYPRIREIYGDVEGYLKPYRNFAADDDINGPVFFARPLLEKALAGSADLSISPAEVGRAWLDYAREGRGMFWWGGYGVSTEHTAFLNLKAGIPAPESGSIARNGATVAEQIGGQIFVDTWGLVWPGKPDEAAEYAAAAASVSHDGEGLNGARFVAACVAAALEPPADGIEGVFAAGLSRIPAGSAYARVLRAVADFRRGRPGDWRACMEYLLAEWGYDRWPGACHVIPNAGVCALALLYGEGDFARTVEIATMCGWDTDCNAGNVGTVAGALAGLEGIPERYRGPINDGLVLSGLPGSLNVLDIPTYSRVLAAAGYRLAGEDPPPALAAALARGDGERSLHFDFALPGSTHNLRVSDPVACGIAHRAGLGAGGGNALEFRFDRLLREAEARLFYKPFYRRADFDDERYSPAFSPTARPGQRVRVRYRLERWEGERIGVSGYVRESSSGRAVECTAPRFPAPGEALLAEFEIPDLGGSQADEVGLLVRGWSGAGKRDSGRLLVDLFEIGGLARYAIDIGKQALEFGCVTPFTHDGGKWGIEEGRLHLMTDVPAASYTGGYAVADQRVAAVVRPLAGESHLLIARASGATRGYLAGLDGVGSVGVYLRDLGLERLGSAPFAWERGRDYRLELLAVGDRLALSIDGREVLSVRDGAHRSGMVGCAALTPSRALYGPFEVEELS